MGKTLGRYPDSVADLAIATGEASGDWIAALAIDSLLTQRTDRRLTLEGIAGPKLRAAGVEPLHQSEDLSVRGYLEVLRHLPRLLKMRKALTQRWSVTHKPRVFLGVDAPDFNLAIELATRAAGVPTVHLVCPSIWAWRMERIHTLKKACDHILCIFPFEPALLAKEGINATYVGHPMAHLVPHTIETEHYRRQLDLDLDGEFLAVLPGSRQAEVAHLGPVLIQSCLKLKQSKPGLSFITPLPAGPILTKFKSMIPAELTDSWTLVEGKSHEAMGASDAVLLASGTATLEAMMFKKPMVIAYKMPWLSYQMMKGKGYMPYVGLPNILLQEFAVPELIQSEATVENLVKHVLFQLDNAPNRDRLNRLFSEQHERLTRPSGQLCADILGQYL